MLLELARSSRLTDYSEKVLGYGPIAYWPLNEASGGVANDLIGNGFNGAYTGVTLGQPGIGDGNSCPYFDGANDYCNFYSSLYASAFNTANGSYSAWVKVYNSSIWTDGNNHQIISSGFWSGDYEEIILRKHSDNNKFLVGYFVPPSYAASENTAMTETGWFHAGARWNQTTNEVGLFINGIPQAASAIAEWPGGAAQNNAFCIGAQNTTPDLPFNGWIAHIAVFNSTLSASTMTDLSVL